MSDSLWPHGLYSLWNSPGQNTGVDSLFLLQGIFPTQGLNPGLPHCRQILYQLSHKGSPRILEWLAYLLSSRSSWLRNLTRVSSTAGGFFINWSIREAQCTELYKKDLNDPDNHDGVITHLDPDILICEVKWALGGILWTKLVGGDRIPAELFQILKDDVVKVLHSNMPANLENSAVATRLEKISFHSNPKERQCQRMLKLPHNCTHLTR